MSTPARSPLTRDHFFANEATRTALARALALRAAYRALSGRMEHRWRHGPLVARDALYSVRRSMRSEAREAVRIARLVKADWEAAGE